MLDAPVDKVWRYLTEAELRREWFMGGTDARADGEFELLNDHDNLSDERRAVSGRLRAVQRGGRGAEKVVRFEPPKLLATTFQGGKNGIVTYELHPEGERTRLVLTHSGIQSGTGAQDFGSRLEFAPGGAAGEARRAQRARLLGACTRSRARRWRRRSARAERPTAGARALSS